jgi:hypothetical protein
MPVHRKFDEKITREKMRKFLRRPGEEKDDNGELEMKLHRRGELEIRFASIEYAIYAHEKISGNKAFENCQVPFVKDPCTESFGTLLEKK